MAVTESTTLRLEMISPTGNKRFNVTYADPEASTSDIAALGAALVDNTDIFENEYTGLRAAAFVTTTVTDITLPTN